jgi:hypothetical protein
MRLLAPLFEEQASALKNKKTSPKDRYLTLAAVLETLKNLRRNEVSVGEAIFHRLSEPNAEQQRILDLLGVKLADPL